MNSNDLDEIMLTQLLNNRLSLCLFWTCWMSQAHATAPGRAGTVMRAIRCGSLAQEAAPHQLLVSLPQLLTQLDATIQHLLSSPTVYLTNSEWMALLEAIQWRVHITDDMDDLPVDVQHMDATVSHMSQYWSWLLAETISVLSNVDPMLISQLKDSIVDVSDALSSTMVPGTVVARRLRRSLERAEPFIDAAQAQTARWIAAILSTISGNIALATSQHGAELIAQFGRILASVGPQRSCDQLEMIAKQLSKLERTLDYSAAHEAAPANHDAQRMIALNDHVILLQHYAAMHRSITCGQDDVDDPDDCVDDDFFESMGSKLAPIPSAVAVLLRSCYRRGIFHPLAGIGPWTEFYLFHWEAVVNLSYLKAVQSSPVFSLSAVDLLLSNVMVLAESTEKRQRLQRFRTLLWANSSQLQRAVFGPQCNDHAIGVDSLRRVTQAVCAALRLPVPPSTRFGI